MGGHGGHGARASLGGAFIPAGAWEAAVLRSEDGAAGTTGQAAECTGTPRGGEQRKPAELLMENVALCEPGRGTGWREGVASGFRMSE